MHKSIRGSLLLGLVLLFGLLTVNAGLVYFNARNIYYNADWVRHTDEALLAIEELFSAVKDAESGQQGYLITGNDSDLTPYHEALGSLTWKRERFRTLTADNPRQQAILPRLDELMQTRLSELARTIALRKESGFDAARNVVLTDDGRESMKAIRLLVDEMRHEELRLLDERSKVARGAYHFGILNNTIASLAALSGLVAIVWLLNRHVAAQSKTAAVVHAERELLKATLLSIGDGVIATDAQGRVRFLNSLAEQLTGWTQADALGKDVREVFHAVHRQTRQPVKNPALEALETGQVASLGENTVLFDKAGVERPIDDSAAPIRDVKGRVSGAVLVFRDVTERYRLEEHLRQAQKMEAVGRLAGGIAHDFNNIMTIITGYSEVLLEDSQSEAERREMVRDIHDAGNRAANLTQQIMAFSRKQMLVPSVLNLNTVVRDMGMIVKRLIGSNIEFITEMAPDLGQVKADPTQIGQVILNLAANARDAMPKPGGGRLVIATANAELNESTNRTEPDVKPGRYAMLTVCDTGIGMSEEVLAHVFEPFFTTKGVGEGTGLGLATVYGIVKQSGGHIEISSRIGEGTTFQVYLPLIEESALTPDREEAHQPANGHETILLVEDEETVRKMTKMMLLQNGYNVLEASNGLEGLAVAKSHPGPIHLLMTDLVMPMLSGREIAERLTTFKPGLRVLFMSGYTEDMIVHQGVESASTNFLPKPFSLAALTKKVREVLEQL